MDNNEHLHLKKQRKNALEILKQWELEINFNNKLAKNASFTKKARCDTNMHIEQKRFS